MRLHSSSPPDFFLGVDGGNTKTIALIARQDGRIVGYGRSGCSDIYQAKSAEDALEAVQTAVHEAWLSSGISASDCVRGTFSMAGADWPEDIEFIRLALKHRFLAHRLTIVNDAMGALRAGTPDGYGVVVVCGTGATTGARSPSGASWHSGWWQEPQGSRHLADQALRAIYRSHLGIDPFTTLVERIVDVFDTNDVEGVLHQITERGVQRRPLNDVTHLLLAEAENGDATARTIVANHGSSLGDYAAAAAVQVGILDTPFILAVTGGVIRHQSTLLFDSLVARVREKAPAARPVLSRFEPAVGAVLLSLEAERIAVNDSVLNNLEKTSPSLSLFETHVVRSE